MMDELSKLPAGAKTVIGVMAIISPIMYMLGRQFPGLMKVWVSAYIVIGALASLAAYIHNERSKKKPGNRPDDDD